MSASKPRLIGLLKQIATEAASSDMANFLRLHRRWFSSLSMLTWPWWWFHLILLPVTAAASSDGNNVNSNAAPLGTYCRSYCGNITVDYPFALRAGCGHSGFRDLLYCINGVLMLHIPSGSYRVLDIDYAYRGLTLHDPGMSDCYSLLRSPAGLGNGFAVEPWRAPYLEPDPDNVFMLLGCRADSPLFQGFPSPEGKHLPCRNVSGMGCEDYYRCPAWDEGPSSRRPRGSASASAYGVVSPPECCALEFGAIRAINVTHLRCEGYSSAYSLAPLRAAGPGAWAYGIRVAYSLPADHQGFCGACRATGGVCGYDQGTDADICLCHHYNSTSNCDSADASATAESSSEPSIAPKPSLATLVGAGFLLFRIILSSTS
ncbi:hypothetical protein MUK42_03713 [Musa troglodytarum]|uniref:Wall-associated receptor kinase galacturonan-binding domain-containing protein n=1 Tax=Musa troglodytarum TaxID=320322 RepID=A0A9E7G694_9LILI|nr:hypothetical protein MUK42_03713 [Musa troglodytarum]